MRRDDALWAVAQCLCIGQQVDPALVTSRQEIGDFYYRHALRRHGPAQEESPLMNGWRRQAVGDPLLNMLDAEGKVSIHWSNVRWLILRSTAFTRPLRL